MTLMLHYGNAVTGAQRFARPDLEARLMAGLAQSAGIKMFGLRRIGKSTLRLHALEQFAAAGRPHAFIDAQGLHSLADLLSRMASAFPEEKSFVSRAFRVATSEPVRLLGEALVKGTAFEEKTLSAYWQVVAEAIKKALAEGGPKPALVIDEFSYLLENMIKRGGEQGRLDADKLLAGLREWRGAGMTMLLTGSIGVTGLARKHRLNIEHLNDLQPFPVPELSEAEARAFIASAVDGPSQGRWTKAHTDEFLKQCGVLYPCFLVRGLLDVGIEHPPAPAAFAEIFSTRVRPYLHSDFYEQFDRRFKAYADLPGGERDALLLPALKAILAAPAPCTSDAIPCSAPFSRVDLALVLTLLTEDGFIHFTEDAEGERLWRPASKLARLWWKRSRLA